MDDVSGFTFLELMVVIAIAGILSALAIPNMISWRNNAQFTGAVNTLAGDLSVAKQSAIRNNSNVVISFAANGYTIFIDDGSGGGAANNGIRDGGEQLLQNRTLPAGVAIDLGATTFAGDMTQFNGAGLCDAANVGTVVVSQGGRQSSISVNRLGRVDLI